MKLAVYNDAVLTDAGRRLVYDAIAAEKSIMFTRIAIGNGSYTVAEKSPERLVTRTALKAAVQDYEISYMRRASDTNIRLGTIITNYDPDTHDPLIANDTYLNEIGIMAKGEDDETDVLYGIAVCRDERGDLIPGYNGTNPIEIIQDFSAYINSNAEVTLEYPETAYARATDLADTQAELEDTEDLLDSAREIMEGNLAPAYDDQTSYVAGDWCIYEHVLYRCSGATTSDFDPTKWDAVPVGSELKTLKKSVSDGKAAVAGAITEMNVPTAADDTFQEMAENILDILTANPGSVSSSVGLEDKSSGGWSDSFVITALMSFLEGYIASKGTEGTAVVKLVADGRTVIATDSENRKIFAMKSVDNGSVSAAVAVSSGTSATVSITAAMTLSEGYISSKGTEGTKSLSVVNNGANVDVKDGNTVVGRVAKTAGSVTATVSTTAGTSSSVSVSPSMSLTAGHISSKGTETAKTLTLTNNGDSVDLKDGSTVIGRVSKTAGTITVTVGTVSNTSNANAVLTPGVTINTAGQHSSSKGTRTVTAKTVSMSNNGANVDLKDGSTVIARIAKTAGSVSSSVSLTSGTGTTITIGTSMSLTAGHISSKGTEGTATVYLRKNGNYVYLSSSSSGGTNYGRYTISTQTKTGYASTAGNVSVSPDSGKYLTGVTINQFRSSTCDPWAMNGGSRYYLKQGADYFGNSVYYTTSTAGTVISLTRPFYANEAGGNGNILLFMGGTCTAGSVSVCISTESTKTPSNFGDNAAYTVLKAWGSGVVGYIMVPLKTKYTNGDDCNGKTWNTEMSGTIDGNTGQYIHILCGNYTASASSFTGQVFVYGAGIRMP